MNIKLTNVVFVVGQLVQGGLERQLLYLIHQLRKEKVSVVCVVWNYNEDDSYLKEYRTLLGEGLIALPKKASSSRKILQLRNCLKRYRPQVAISFTAFVNFPTWLATLGLSSIAVGSLRNSAAVYLEKGGVKAFINLLLPLRTLVNSQKAIDEIDKIPFLSKFVKNAFIPNVLDVDFINSRVDINTEFQTISVGNAWPQKRLDRLIEVLAELKKSDKIISHLHIGAGPDLTTLQATASNLGLEENLTFLGSRKDVYSLLKQSSIFLHFAAYEGSPNVIMEAMAAGLPVITSDCGDVRRYVKNEKNGFIIEPFSTNAFAEKIVLLQENEAQRAVMAKQSLELIRASDWSNLSQYFLECLRELGLSYYYPNKTNAKT